MEPPKAKESSAEMYCTVYTPVRGRECRRRQARGVQRWLCNSYINIFGQLCRPAETDQLGTRGEGGIPTLTLQYRGSPTIPHLTVVQHISQQH